MTIELANDIRDEIITALRLHRADIHARLLAVAKTHEPSNTIPAPGLVVARMLGRVWCSRRECERKAGEEIRQRAAAWEERA